MILDMAKKGLEKIGPGVKHKTVEISTIKVMICNKYKSLNKITKILHISLKFNRLLFFVILYSLQCKIEGHAV